jgi:hypothetical protein
MRQRNNIEAADRGQKAEIECEKVEDSSSFVNKEHRAN